MEQVKQKAHSWPSGRRRHCSRGRICSGARRNACATSIRQGNPVSLLALRQFFWAMSIVALLAVRSNGHEYPWSYAIWTKHEDYADKKPSKLDLDGECSRHFQNRLVVACWSLWTVGSLARYSCSSANHRTLTGSRRPSTVIPPDD